MLAGWLFARAINTPRLTARTALSTVAAMGLFDSWYIGRAARALEASLQPYQHGGVGLDLPEDTKDPSKVDGLTAAATLKLLKKYGKRLVVSRFRGRVQLAWRESAFGVVQRENRERLEGVGFYAGPETGSIDPINPGGLADPRTAEGRAAIEASRRARVEAWKKAGWLGDPGWEAEGGGYVHSRRWDDDVYVSSSDVPGGKRLVRNAIVCPLCKSPHCTETPIDERKITVFVPK